MKISSRYKADNGAIDLVDIKAQKHDGNISAPPDKLHPNL